MAQQWKKMTNEEMLKKLTTVPYTFLMKDEIVKFRKVGSPLFNKMIGILESTQKDEPDYFWRDSGKGNLLTYFYLQLEPKTTKMSAAEELVDECLKREPKSVNALTNKIHILIIQEENKEANKLMRELVSLETENTDCMKLLQLIAKAEVAYGFSYVEPKYYVQAIERYEEVLKEYQQIPEEIRAVYSEELQLENKCIMWKYHLAQTYGKMLNKGNVQCLVEKYPITEAYKRIKKGLTEVIESKNEIYCGKALVDLVDAFKKYQTNGGNSREKFDFQGKNENECMAEAYEVCEKDPYVLEKCGRHFRQKAQTKDDFLFAIRVLKEGIDICPSRHVAWHHMGLAYKSLWLEVEGHKREARLHNNKARKGEKDSVRKNWYRENRSQSYTTDQKHQGNNWREKQNRGGSKDQRQQQRVDQNTKHHEGGSRSSEQQHGSFQHNLGTESSAAPPTILDNTSKQLTKLDISAAEIGTASNSPASAPVKMNLPFLFPKFTTEAGNLPRHQKKPDYFDKIRVSNPKCKNPEQPHEYLIEALKCLKKADELAKKTSCRYLVDLARIHISMDEANLALKCFKEAKQTAMNDNDGTYLYEQWAILRTEMLETNADEEEYDDVKSLYRTSIEHAVKAKVRSKMAFYNLRDILKKQLENRVETDPDYKGIKWEYILLYKTMEQFSVAEEALKTALETDPENVEIILTLIDVFYERYCKTGSKRNSDISAAFTYTIVLKNSGVFDLKSHPEEILKFLNIARTKKEMEYQTRTNGEQKSEEENQTEGNGERGSHQDSAFKEIFNWMVEYTCLKEKRFKVDDRNEFEKHSSSTGGRVYDLTDICVISTDDDKIATQITQALSEKCNLTVNCWPQDVLPGRNVPQDLILFIGSAKVVLVVLPEQTVTNEDQYLIQTSLDCVTSLMSPGLESDDICLIRADGHTPVESIRSSWPQVVWDIKLDTITLLYTLFLKIYLHPHSAVTSKSMLK